MSKSLNQQHLTGNIWWAIKLAIYNVVPAGEKGIVLPRSLQYNCSIMDNMPAGIFGAAQGSFPRYPAGCCLMDTQA
jgi:hypothetical protein